MFERSHCQPDLSRLPRRRACGRAVQPPALRYVPPSKTTEEANTAPGYRLPRIEIHSALAEVTRQAVVNMGGGNRGVAGADGNLVQVRNHIADRIYSFHAGLL